MSRKPQHLDMPTLCACSEVVIEARVFIRHLPYGGERKGQQRKKEKVFGADDQSRAVCG